MEPREKRRIITLGYKSLVEQITTISNLKDKQTPEDYAMANSLIEEAAMLEEIIINDDFDRCALEKVSDKELQ